MTRANTAEAKRSETTYSSICFDLVKGEWDWDWPYITGGGSGVGLGSKVGLTTKNGDKYLRFICALWSEHI